ncbi:Hsp90 ATPase activator [Vairimorpha necatrix]|uniref:Hsp90 ATPase activator n=1 Tax=Vairimorpha necatrix TaxID=6039 RepID=A0AAX4JFT8_9MICR
MNAEERMKNYHWSESDISTWAKEKIINELNKRNYEIIKTDIFVKICSRMNNLGLIYIIELDALKDNKSCILTNFTTTHEENEGLKDFPWFLDFFKELEGEALLKFSKNVLEIKNTVRPSVDVPNIKADVKTSGKFIYSSTVNCPPEEFQNFLVKDEFIRCWARDLKIEKDEIFIGKIQLKIIEVKEGNVKMEFKLDEWAEITKVEIKISELRGNTKIDLKQEDVPLKYIDTMTGMWRENIFMPICMAFGFHETPLKN